MVFRSWLKPSVLHIFDSRLSLYPKSYKQHDIGCTEDQMSRMCEHEDYNPGAVNIPLVKCLLLGHTF